MLDQFDHFQDEKTKIVTLVQKCMKLTISFICNLKLGSHGGVRLAGVSLSPIFSHIVKDNSWKKLDNRCMKRIHILFVSSKGSYINYVIADRGRGKGGFYK